MGNLNKWHTRDRKRLGPDELRGCGEVGGCRTIAGGVRKTKQSRCVTQGWFGIWLLLLEEAGDWNWCLRHDVPVMAGAVTDPAQAGFGRGIGASRTKKKQWLQGLDSGLSRPWGSGPGAEAKLVESLILAQDQRWRRA